MSLVSVILPVFNTGEYLSKCFDSILQQTHKDVEIIAVNDNSTDPLTLDKLKQYQEKYHNFKCVTNETNLGPSGSRNRGVEIAKGKYLCFVDSDDYLLPDFIETMVSALEKYNTSYVVCNFDDFQVDGNDEKYVKSYTCPLEPNKIYPAHELLDDLKAIDLNIAPFARMIPREEYLKTKNKFFEGSLFQDHDWNLRLIINAKTMVYLNYNGYKRRLRPTSIIHSTKDSRVNHMIFVCYRMYESLTQINRFEENKEKFFLFYMYSCLSKLTWFEKKEDRDKFIKLYLEHSAKMGYKVDDISKANYIKFKLLYKLFKLIGNQEKKKAYKTRYIQQKFLLKYMEQK